MRRPLGLPHGTHRREPGMMTPDKGLATAGRPGTAIRVGGMVGFSAGGHLALATATSFEKRTYEPIDAVDTVSCRPDFAVLCYSGYLKAKDKDEISPGIRIPADTPPIFLAHSSDDKIQRRRAQRDHVSGLEAREDPDGTAHLCDRRP